MATAEQRARRKAQRATAARVRQARETHRPMRSGVPKSVLKNIRQSQIDQAYRWASGEETPQTPAEIRQAARMGSYARWGKADPRFLAAFQQYFYKDEKSKSPDEEE